MLLHLGKGALEPYSFRVNLLAEPSLFFGRVAYAEFDDIAVSDISSTLPNVSGGAVFPNFDSSDSPLTGIHLGIYYHEETSFKRLIKGIDSSEAFASPLENTQLRAKHAAENVGHKCAMS